MEGGGVLRFLLVGRHNRGTVRAGWVLHAHARRRCGGMQKAWLARIAGTRVEGLALAALRGLVAPFASVPYGNDGRQAFSHTTYPYNPVNYRTVPYRTVTVPYSGLCVVLFRSVAQLTVPYTGTLSESTVGYRWVCRWVP